MDTKTLRPSSDSGSPGHNLSSGSSAYLLIDDATADNDSTYISQSVSSTSRSTKTTTVGFESVFSSSKYTVTACRLYFVARRSASNSSSATVTFSVGGSGSYTVSASSLSNSYTTYNAANANMASAITQALRGGSIPAISAVISTSGTKSSSKDDSSEIRITQVYLEIDYEDYVSSLFVKENGSWREYNQAYKKVNGQWVLQNDLSSVFASGVNYVKGN